jgi:hypothetical protein
MKYLYLVNFWVPFPSSEYGGLINVIAENDIECHNILRDTEEFYHDQKYSDRIMEAVVDAPRFQLTDDEPSRVVDYFIT